ncbi:ATP-binding cassette domain-containing protein [Deferribacterales bacterium Es71-Z0220]|uniref:ATP-binding cassette domain-containing protein n=1 Tax=Deferrivibrio essentukiensis TaxID=2880922 RepID=UPI001F61C839|nr:ATP-binding cassette domain-containing protein [Deferrivibrio essentukiensis]MCB4204338.1 ATP-binding cassette domain-containing protein [Deferrivibrio essentukiensis]
MNIIEATNITKRYKKSVALDNVSVKIPKKSLTCIVGPDGAGKSTLLKILAGVLKFDSGYFSIFGKEIIKMKDIEHLKDNIAFMPQGLGLNLYQRLSIEENINFFADLHGIDKKTREDRKVTLLKATGLLNFRDRQVNKLSGGMKQKLGICCSLIHSPKIIILDEPTTGVDPISRRELYRLIYQFIDKEGVTAVVSTSYMDEAERGDTTLFMHNGKIIFSSKENSTENCLIYKKPDFIEFYNTLNNSEHYFATLGRNFVKFLPKQSIGYEDCIKVECGIEEKTLKIIGTRKLNLNLNSSKSIGGKILGLESVTKKFGDFHAVKNVSFEVYKGEIIGLLGPNGAGKTTLMKILLGLYKPTSGKYDFFIDNTNIKENIGYMSQKFSLYNDLTVKENLKLNAAIRNIKNPKLAQKINELYTIGNLEKYQNEIVEKLPLGIKQRIALMCAIVHEPKLVFLDEPTSGVDISERDVFWQIIRYLSNNKNTTFIVSTHFMKEADFCDKICLMNNGEVVEYNTPENLRENFKRKYGQPYSIKTKNPYKLEESLRKAGFYTDIFGNKVKVFAKNLDDLSSLNMTFSAGEVSIEDIFVGATENVEY